MRGEREGKRKEKEREKILLWVDIFIVYYILLVLVLFFIILKYDDFFLNGKFSLNVV